MSANRNTGHGHVTPRPDGFIARCGGPLMCSVCALEKVQTDIDSINRIAQGGRENITFDLVSHLLRQREFSLRTFGPGARTSGVIDHIRKELAEIEAAPNDLDEWIDIVLLALDGAWRAGHEPENIANALAAKQAKNESRQWPDWKTVEPGKAIEHVREGGAE